LGLGILQHPSEQHQAKGTARLAHLCLQDCPIWVGESVDALADLQAWLQAKPTLLLFPAQEDSAPNQVVYTENMSDTSVSEIQVLLLDGTWRKAYKLLQTNPALQALPRLQLSGEWQSAYAIRKAPNIRSLSTLEAIHAVLCELEGEPSRFDGLSLALADFVAQRQAFANGRDDSTRPGEKR
jgi:Uncharacterized conserved protein